MVIQDNEVIEWKYYIVSCIVISLIGLAGGYFAISKIESWGNAVGKLETMAWYAITLFGCVGVPAVCWIMLNPRNRVAREIKEGKEGNSYGTKS